MRMSSARFLREFRRSPTLQRALLQFTDSLMIQISQTAACNRFHIVEARLARWLLMTAERMASSEFHLTHEFLADMLGVRREGVTVAAMRPAARANSSVIAAATSPSSTRRPRGQRRAPAIDTCRRRRRRLLTSGLHNRMAARHAGPASRVPPTARQTSAARSAPAPTRPGAAPPVARRIPSCARRRRRR